LLEYLENQCFVIITVYEELCSTLDQSSLKFFCKMGKGFNFKSHFLSELRILS